MSGSAEPAEAAGSGAQLPSSSLPWHQIPKFEPGVTDLRTYTRKLEFLRDLWPPEHIQHLAPRAALQVEGVAFQKIARLKADKLRSADGVKYLVESLGGTWGRLDDEDRYDLFERALYTTKQYQDETNDSYLSRHDVAFDDLLSREVKLEEIRAYILLRQSSLAPEDRKKVIMDAGGKLEYDKAKKAIRLLGSRFFSDLQSGSRGVAKQKTYDINYTDEAEDIHHAWVPQEPEMDEDAIHQVLLEEHDEDAHFVQDFEEQILLTCQDSQELAACFSTYQEARDRLREKARSRGFWPLWGKDANSKGRGGGKKGKAGGPWNNNSSFAQRRKSLAERIANSNCRKCGQPGHWRRECPMNSAEKEKTNFTGLAETQSTEVIEPILTQDVIDTLPSDAIPIDVNDVQVGQNIHGLGECSLLEHFHWVDKGSDRGQVCHCLHVDGCGYGSFPNAVSGFNDVFITKLTSKLTTCCRNHFGPRTDAATASVSTSDPCPTVSTGAEPESSFSFSGVDCLFNCEETTGEAIIDTGASRAVIGEQRLKGMLDSLPDHLRKLTYRARTPGVVFKFGNSSKLTSRFAILLPRSEKGWIRVEVVPGQTPFLISNSILRGLRGIVDVEDQVLRLKVSGFPHRFKHFTAMSSIASRTYLTEELTFLEDETLRTHTTHWDIGAIHKPPGIRTLDEWGQIRAPSGKHPGKTFSEIFQNDQCYVGQMWNRRGVSSWVRSFQMYCRAMKKLEPSPDHFRLSQLPVAPKSKAQASSSPTPSEEWTHVSAVPESKVKEVKNPKGEHKRPILEEENKMKTEVNQERVGSLRAQIAIMQRELDRELHGQNSSQSSDQVLEGN
eukprot:s45_g13.t1